MFFIRNSTNITPIENHFCFKILYINIPTSQIRIWDLVIFFPNVLFLIYLLFHIIKSIRLLRRSKRYIFMTLYLLILISQTVSIIRCIVSMSVHNNVYSFVDRAMWLFLKFVLLATELSVVTFGFFFGHLDSKSSIQRVLCLTFTISLIYSSIQGTLEFIYDNKPFHDIKVDNEYYSLFGHGGLIFWFSSSLLLCLIYSVIIFLPFTRIQHWFILPAKKSFYIYCSILAFLNFLQSIGSILLFVNIAPAICIVDVTSYLYFAGFSLLIYVVFIHQFIAVSSSSQIQFSYHTQYEDEEEELPAPHHLTHSINSDTFYPEFLTSNDSTHFIDSSNSMLGKEEYLTENIFDPRFSSSNQVIA